MRAQQKALVAVWCLTLGLAGCGEFPERDGVSGAPAISEGDDSGEGTALQPFITDGKVDSGHPSVGQLRSGGAACTATLIGQKTVLTAGHCVPSSASRTSFVVGGKSYTASKIIIHPSYGGGNRHDIAVVLLSQSPSGVNPSPVNTDTIAVGQAVTLVGYGLIGENSGSFGTKRSATNTISGVTATTMRFDGRGNVCNGDSGGPSFVRVQGEERVAGVHSTKSGFCGNAGTDMRVDAYINWLVKAANNDVVQPGNTPPPSNGNPPPPPPPPSDCHTRPPFDWAYCTPGCPCGEGEGDCDTNADCKPGYVCTHNVGADIGQHSAMDVCRKDPNSGGGGSGGSGGGGVPAKAKEGDSCQTASCDSGLSCVTVFESLSGKAVGKFCMETCKTLGNDPICDGGESCLFSNSANARVCFDQSQPQNGYTNRAGAGGSGSGGSGGSGSGGSGSGSGGSGQCGMTQIESEVFALLNQERAKNGAAPINCDAGGVKVARAHSQDMCDKNYFSHTSKDGRQPWDRLRAGGVSFSAAGENIAWGQRTAAQVNQSWMNSSGHRRNMLSPSWTRVGIGYVSCGGRPYWTEVFMR
jgi:uncharacterized protein YkwD